MHGAKTWVEINSQALRSNIAALRSLLSPGVIFSGVVKANAYGHGLPQVVTVMLEEGVNYFCVDSIDEAMQVRSLASEAVIIILGYTLRDRLADVVMIGAQQTVYDAETIHCLNEESAKQGREVGIHLKVETGTMRQGAWKRDVPGLLQQIGACQHLRLVGVSSHFASIEEADAPGFTDFQLDTFFQVCGMVQASGFAPPLIHMASSGAVILYPSSHGSLVRPGVATYGFWPSREVRNAARLSQRWIELEAVLSWKTRVAQIKEAPMGAPIGYGCTEVLRRHSKIAVLPIGYWDGFDRRLASTGEVLIRGQLCKVLGRVCMNMCMVDVTEVPRVMVEDEVVLIGRAGKNRMRADDIADRAGTIHYEVTTRINPLIPRVLVPGAF